MKGVLKYLQFLGASLLVVLLIGAAFGVMTGVVLLIKTIVNHTL